jgi:hypothetical protein
MRTVTNGIPTPVPAAERKISIGTFNIRMAVILTSDPMEKFTMAMITSHNGARDECDHRVASGG